MTDLSALPSSLASAAHDLFDSLLADLSSLGARQHTRLLRLHTPLGADVLMAERAVADAILRQIPEARRA